MSKKRMVIDWQKLWDDFDVWHANRSKITICATCKKIDQGEPEWLEQKAKIRLLVNAQIRKIV